MVACSTGGCCFKHAAGRRVSEGTGCKQAAAGRPVSRALKGTNKANVLPPTLQLCCKQSRVQNTPWSCARSLLQKVLTAAGRATSGHCQAPQGCRCCRRAGAAHPVNNINTFISQVLSLSVARQQVELARHTAYVAGNLEFAAIEKLRFVAPWMRMIPQAAHCCSLHSPLQHTSRHIAV